MGLLTLSFLLLADGFLIGPGSERGCLGFVTVASKGKFVFVFVLVPVARTGVFVVVVIRSALNQLNIFSITIL